LPSEKRFSTFPNQHLPYSKARMDEYDEFGNPLFLEEEDEEQGEGFGEIEALQDEIMEPTSRAPAVEPLEGYDEDEEMQEPTSTSQAIVLHEVRSLALFWTCLIFFKSQDKRYYSSAQDVYGADVETLVQEEDTQPLTQPIIAPVKKKTFRVISKEESGPVTRYDKNFLLQLMSYQDSVRNVCVVGHLHHGKTALMDMLVYETHQLDWDVDKQVIELLVCSQRKLNLEQLKYTDPHVLAQARGISLKSTPMSLVLPSSKGKSYLLNMIDTPGHVNFLVRSRLFTGSALS
jgi:U5 small nuclear ribonucleoprotein component